MTASFRSRTSEHSKDASPGETSLKVLVCGRCQTELTRAVEINPTRRTPADLADINPREAGDPAAVPAGSGVTVWMEIWSGHFYGEGELLAGDRIWLNLADVDERVVIDAKLGHGCCGPAGQICRRCQCGALVGREYSDCLSAHYFSPEPDMTEWVDCIEDETAREAARAERFARASRQAKRDRAHHNKKSHQ